MFLGYLVGWLRTVENTFLTTPVDAVKQMPTRVQEQLGYKPHVYLGVVDSGNPLMVVLRE